ncbi:MAG: hypothetical protein KatS3mg110_0586 [Pirellulaceae bacterium]|nr:MAG: hypothetical protein KatS3mg110_0586 [Pirellulaceae bacterium]
MKSSIRRSIKRFWATRKARRARSQRRFLQSEALENRLLLASDFQNPINPYDVNLDFRVTGADVLAVVRDLAVHGARNLLASRTAGGEGESQASSSRFLVDVNGDGRVTSGDAMAVLKKLAEGAPGDPQARFRIYFQSTTGTPLTSVSVGQTFIVKLTVQDIRNPNDPRFPEVGGDPNKLGLTQAFMDLIFSLNTQVVQNFFTNPTRTFNHLPPYNSSLSEGSNEGVPFPNLGVGIIEDLGGVQFFDLNDLNTFRPLGPNEQDLVAVAFRVVSGNPRANNDSFNVNENSTNVRLNVLANDTVDGNVTMRGQFANGLSNQVTTFNADPNNINSYIVPESEIIFPTASIPINGISLGGLTIVSVSVGTATVNNNGTPAIGSDDFIEYTPPAGFTGQALIVYRISDGQGTTATATATVSVGPVNDPPVNTVPGTQTIDEDAPLVFSTAGSNAIAVSDPDAGSANIQMDLTVQNGRLQISSTTGLTVTGQNSSSLRLVGPISAINAALGAGLTYTPNPDFNGQDLLVVVSNDLGNTGDGGPQTDTDTVTIVVRAVNDPPVNALPGNQMVEEETPLTFSTANGNVISLSDVDAGTATIETRITLSTTAGPNPGTFTLGSTSGITIVGGANGSASVTIRGSQSALRNALLNSVYTPPAGFIGDVTLTMVTNDLGNTGSGPAGGLTDTDSITISVEPRVRPRARNDQATVAESSPAAPTSVTIDVLANDIANVGAQVTLVSFTQPANGTVTRDDRDTPGDPTDDRLIYRPNNHFFGTDTFTYTINDTSGLGADNTGTVTVTVTEINDPPVAVDDQVSTDEDVPIEIVALTLTGNDSPGPNESSQTLSIISVSSTSAQGGTVSLSGGVVRYTPPVDFNGTDTFTYTIQDNGTTNGVSDPKTATGTVTVTVRSVNDPPVPGNDTVTTAEDTSLDIATTDLLANDGPGGGPDEAGQTLAIIDVSSSSARGGTVVLSGGTITYTPPADFFGQDTFTYTVQDNGTSNGVSDPKTAVGTVTVNVTPVNDPPVVVDDSDIGVKNFTTSYPASKLLANDRPGPTNEVLPPESQTLRISRVVATSERGGTVVLDGQTIRYTPPTDYLGPDVITYFVQDDGKTNGVDDFKETEAHLNLDVIDFIPSPISGYVYLDVNNNGIKDPQERGVGNVRVDLVDTSTNTVLETKRTDHTGFYEFVVMRPGTYRIVEHTPRLIMDGLDSIGTHGGTVENDQFTITLELPGGINSRNNNFGERGLDAQFFTIHELLASRGLSSNGTTDNGLVVGYDPAGVDFWYVVLGGWDNLRAVTALLQSNQTVVRTTVNDQVEQKVRDIPVDGNRVRILGRDGTGQRVIRFDGAAVDFGFLLSAAEGEPGTAEGEAVEQFIESQLADARYREAVDQVMAETHWA